MSFRKIYLIANVFLPVLLMTAARTTLGQQRVQFTQYMFNGLVINPAYAGADEKLSLTFMQRNQWASIDNAPSTQTLSAHKLFRKKQVGLGLMLVNDQIGIHRNLDALASYAYHIRMSKNAYLSMGLQAGVKSVKSDYGSLTGNDGSDPGLYNVLVSKTFFDMAAGIYYRSPRFHIGLSAPEMLPQEVYINQNLTIHLNKVNFFLFSKYTIPANDDFDIEPSFLIKYLDGTPLSFDINANMIYRKVIMFGLSYRNKESIDFLFKATVTPQLVMGYSYDHPVGIISQFSTNGSHELMVQYLFRYQRTNVTSPR